MDLTLWMPGMFLLGLGIMALLGLFINACDRV